MNRSYASAATVKLIEGIYALPVPSVDEVRQIVAIANPVIRNLRITHCYSRLAAAFAARSGDGANWCSYATWASRQAGRTVRGEDLLEHLGNRFARHRWALHPIRTLWRRLLRHGLFQPETRIGRLTAELHTPFDAFEGASAAVARGNLRVFEEIGLEFARYLHECPPETPANAPEVRRFLDSLRPGDPEGQRYLRQGFTHYERLRFERDPKARAELTVLANLEIGFHEQTPAAGDPRGARCRARNEGGSGAACVRIAFPLDGALVVGRPGSGGGRYRRRRGRLPANLEQTRTRGDHGLVHGHDAAGAVLALGTHLDDDYPEVLKEPADAELIELLARFEPVAGAPDDCGARDWSDLQQRMHYIVHLFRAFHLDEQLSRPPFTPEQVEDFSSGVVPDGDLREG